MGKKVNPIGIRLGHIEDWRSTWYASKQGDQYARYLHADLALRKFFETQMPPTAQISRVDIERLAKSARVTVHTARPGVVIGKKGSDAAKLRDKVSSILGVTTHVNVAEIRKPELDAQLVADTVAGQLEKRVMFRRAMKRAVSTAMRSGALGIKISVSGRLGGAEIARSEWYREGRVPLHTFRANIDYAIARSNTTYGVIGVKVWIFKGEILPHQEKSKVQTEAEPAE